MIKRPVFIKTVLMMLVVALVVLTVFIPIYNKVLQSERQKAIEERRYYFERSVAVFNDKIMEAQRIVSLLNSSYAFLRLKNINNKSDLQYYARLTDAAILTQNAFRLSDSQRTTFIYLSRSDSIIAANLISDTSHEFFSRKVIFQDMNPDDVVNTIMLHNTTMSFLPQHRVKIMGGEAQYLPFIYRDHSDSSVLCVLFSVDEISAWFDLDFYEPDDFFFFITSIHDNAEVVYSHGQSAAIGIDQDVPGYTMISSKFSNLNYQCVLGISDTFFSPYVKPSRMLLIFTIIAAAIAAVLVSYLLAVRSYLPLRDLLSLSSRPGSQPDPAEQNEYACIRHYIEKICQTNQHLSNHIDGLRSEMRSNTLIRLIFEFPQQVTEFDIDLALLPQLADDYRIAVIGFDSDSEAVMLALQSHLSQQLDDTFCIARLKKRQLAVLLPDNQECLDILEQAVTQTADKLEHVLHAGVSESFSSVTDLKTALCQAQKVLTHDNILNLYAGDQEEPHQHLDIHRQNTLFNLIASGDCHQAVAMIHTIAASMPETPGDVHVFQTYYLIRSVVEQVSMSLSIQDIALPENPNGGSVMKLYEALEDAVKKLCEENRARMTMGNRKLKLDIIDFVHQHYTSADLYSNLIADHFQISNKYVFQLIKDQTGTTLNKYIEALRMELALDKVQNTQLPINKIAPLCGYLTLNNFYKAFKKYYGKPPGFFRKS